MDGLAGRPLDISRGMKDFGELYRSWYILGEVGVWESGPIWVRLLGIPEFHGSMNLFQPRLVHSYSLCGMASVLDPKYPPYLQVPRPGNQLGPLIARVIRQ